MPGSQGDLQGAELMDRLPIFHHIGMFVRHDGDKKVNQEDGHYHDEDNVEYRDNILSGDIILAEIDHVQNDEEGRVKAKGEIPEMCL